MWKVPGGTSGVWTCRLGLWLEGCWFKNLCHYWSRPLTLIAPGALYDGWPCAVTPRLALTCICVYVSHGEKDGTCKDYTISKTEWMKNHYSVILCLVTPGENCKTGNISKTSRNCLQCLKHKSKCVLECLFNRVKEQRYIAAWQSASCSMFCSTVPCDGSMPALTLCLSSTFKSATIINKHVKYCMKDSCAIMGWRCWKQTTCRLEVWRVSYTYLYWMQ